MGCSDCYNGSSDQIPIDTSDTLFSEIPQDQIKKYAYYVDGETYF